MVRRRRISVEARSGTRKIPVGAWRAEQAARCELCPAPPGGERLPFEAPAASRLDQEMKAFLEWFNGDADAIDPVLKAGIAHLCFATIHPFEHGNGRIARVIADQQLARSEQSAQRFYSTQKGGLEITPWLQWFLGCLDRPFEGAETILGSVLFKARFWDLHAGQNFNERQRTVIKRLLDGFEGKMTSSKWAKLTKSSQDTRVRDITDLVQRGILAQGWTQHQLFARRH